MRAQESLNYPPNADRRTTKHGAPFHYEPVGFSLTTVYALNLSVVMAHPGGFNICTSLGKEVGRFAKHVWERGLYIFSGSLACFSLTLGRFLS